ncbi:MAG: Hsp20/alpha crystallin family protein [Flavobacteriales bacterium]|nr:Hsp20/alpha crystallin family protein [Flavobacteriales bacterium]
MTLIKSNFPAWAGMTDFFDNDWLRAGFDQPMWSPAVNVIDHEGAYEIEVVAPGFQKSDFDVSVENRVLVVTGKSETEKNEQSKKYTRKEFSLKSFSKSFTLPDDVTDEDIKARYTDGVLRLELKKTGEKAPAKKEVSVG